MIPLFAPLRQNQALSKAIQTKLGEVVASGQYVLGREVEAFEEGLARRLGYPRAIGCSSGTGALILALKVLELEPGDEVVTPAFSFVAPANAIGWAGLKPVFADVDPRSGNVTPESVASVITARTRAIVAVDLYGRQAPVRELRRLADRYGIYVIEDGSQSPGLPSAGPRGAHLYTTSFYPTRIVGALGDAGAVLTHDPELATRVREMSRQGGALPHHHVRLGTTASMDSLQAAVLGLKLSHLDAWLAHRRTIASWYYRHLAAVEARGKVLLPPVPEVETSHVWSLFTVRVPQGRDALAGYLKERGIGCGVYYPKPVPRQPAFRRYSQGDYPGAEKLAREALSLPIYPELTTAEFASIVKAVAAWAQGG